ncbi:hypothetical protein HPB50_008756 [Hyalomma asiaticum]|uniref:Uncharacterized protein n=1 Tax=Hyalomma asiaticum TaxID=266040 RepID=A0ACB7TKV9_HYAAI|nr:hypothetical protein HPB50_008756 [Hyalomma asiaticum]
MYQVLPGILAAAAFIGGAAAESTVRPWMTAMAHVQCAPPCRPLMQDGTPDTVLLELQTGHMAARRGTLPDPLYQADKREHLGGCRLGCDTLLGTNLRCFMYQVRIKELEGEALKPHIELQKLKLQAVPSDDAGWSDKCGLARYADQLRAVLSPMPVSDELVPAWFRSAENMLRSCAIPEDVQGAIILPFLNEKCRTLVANQADARVLSYEEELKLTPEEYKRRLYACRKGDETKGQFATRLEILLDYYLRSREIKTVQQRRALLISDRVKQLMGEDMRTYILQQETTEYATASERQTGRMLLLRRERALSLAVPANDSEINGSRRGEISTAA